jgi:carbonic anhydrase
MSQSPINIKGDDASVATGVISRSISSFNTSELTKSSLNGVYTVSRSSAIGVMTANLPGTTTSVQWTCTSFVFHAPSEHELDGDSFDLEMQAWCTSSTSTSGGNVAAFAWLYDEGTTDQWIEDLLFGTEVSAVVDSIGSYYGYTGSYTQPSCSEGVYWYVMSTPGEHSKKVIDYFEDQWADNDAFANGEGNNRSTQSVNSRAIYVYGEKYDDDSATYLAALFVALLL